MYDCKYALKLIYLVTLRRVRRDCASIIFLATVPSFLTHISIAQESSASSVVPTRTPGTLVIAHDAHYPPYEFLDGNRSDGFGIDVITQAARLLDLRVEYKALQWDEVLQALNRGEADITPEMMHSAERKNQWSMGRPWGESWSVVFVRDASSFTKLEDLRGRSLVAPVDDVESRLLTQKFGVVPEQDASTLDALTRLAEGSVDGVGCNRDVAFFVLASHPLIRSKVKMLNEPLARTPYSVAAAPGNSAVAEALTSAIERLKDSGAYEAIHQKWFLRHSPEYERTEARRGVWRFMTSITVVVVVVCLTGVTLWTLRERNSLKTKVEERTAALQHSEAIYRELAESMRSALIKVRAGGEIMFVNSFACELFGYLHAELIGKSIFDAIIPIRDQLGHHTRDDIARMFSEMSTEEVRTHVNQNIRKDGRLLWVAWSNRCIIKATNECEILCVGQDITPLRVAEDALRRANKELAEACQEAQTAGEHKTRFLSAMSHELRTPLNGILGFTDLLRQQFFGPLNEKQSEYVARIDTCGKHLLGLINDLLDMAKIDSGRMVLESERVSLRQVIDESVAMMEELFNKKHQTVLRSASDDPMYVNGDTNRCKQILLNLLSNAQKYTADGGRVEIRSFRQGDGFMRTEVIDNGIGIPTEQQPHIFSEFYQAEQLVEQAVRGTGIGLALTKRFVVLQGGSIGFTSQIGKGSVFWFSLPTHEIVGLNTKIRNDTNEVTLRNASIVQRKILVAEDNDMNLALILDMLRIRGDEALVARNGLEAVELAKRLRPDLILMDMKMPVMDGLEATACLKRDAELCHVPIIALTASAGAEAEATCRNAGCSAHLAKPIQSGDLFAVLDRFLSNHFDTNLE